MGDGLVDMPRMIDLLKTHQRSPNIVLEGWMDQQENETKTVTQEEDWIRQGVSYLRSIL
jgi:L-ribulose-5-phosphate 3-epimerase UlaE